MFHFFVETIIHFLDSLMKTKLKRTESIYFYIYFNIINVFFTFDQFNASLQIKVFFFLSYLPHNGSVLYQKCNIIHLQKQTLH